MSDTNLQTIHTKSSAILEELYTTKGQPKELDEAFMEEYFNLVKESIDTDLADVEVLGPHKTNVDLSQGGRLIDVKVPIKNEKFLVSEFTAVKTIAGTSQRIGSDRGRGPYLMTSVSGIPSVTMRTGKAIVTFLGYPNSVQTESGFGEWVKA